MEIAVFSWPETLEGEADAVVSLFRAGLTTFHLRKPGWSESATREWLQTIPNSYHSRIILHQHFGLSDEFALKGIHFSKRYPLTDYGDWLRVPGFTFSAAIHDPEAFDELPPGIDRVFLSPVFTSISKAGHPGRFDEETLRSFLSRHSKPPAIFALGGVQPGKIPHLQALGFDGAGVLGAIWHPFQQHGTDSALKVFQEFTSKIEQA